MTRSSFRWALLPAVIALVPLTSASQSGYYPPPGCVQYADLSLTVCPPDSMPAPPVQLLKYIIYANGVFIDDIIVPSPVDTVVYYFEDTQLVPGLTEFCVRAVYNEWISEPWCITDTVFYGFPLPFYEDWSSGSLETNRWTAEGGNWTVSATAGMPAPSLAFYGQPALEDYSLSTVSFYLTRDSLPMQYVYVDCDVRLNSINQTGEERLSLERWHWESDTWQTLGVVRNLYPGLYHLRHRLEGVDNMFRLRFRASGMNSADISSWRIDNIRVVQECAEPENVMVRENITTNVHRVKWNPPIGIHFPNWNWYGDTVNYTSIGTGGTFEFQVAAKWDGFSQYQPSVGLTSMKFFPRESNAQYTVRVWQGQEAELVYEKYIPTPLIHEWNTVAFDSMLVFSSGETVWVGYHILANAGYPAGCDDGPAVNGYGNMIYYEDEWQTLLQVNPELDFNWNIQVEVKTPGPQQHWLSHYNVYRSDLPDGDYVFLDTTVSNIYLDTLHPPWQFMYCYKVSAVWADGADTCVSLLSREGCTPVLLGNEDHGIISETVNLMITPNPARNMVRITAGRPLTMIEIYTLTGNRAFWQENKGPHAEINVAHLPDGLYVVKVVADTGPVCGKLVIVR